MTVELLDDASKHLPHSALHQSITTAAMQGHSSQENSTGATEGSAEPPPLLQTRHYSPQAQLCLVRVSHAQSRQISEAIGSVRYVHQRPVRLKVVRAFGNARLARRELARQLEDALRNAIDRRARKALDAILYQIAELQRR